MQPTSIGFTPDPRRVIAQPFLPDEQILPDQGLLGRILALSEDVVEPTLVASCAKFTDRHRDLETILEGHFQYVCRGSEKFASLSRARRLLIGAYFTREFSIETAALTNPSIVPAPDQSGLSPDELRVVISLRAIGEGHLSSIEFRSAVIDGDGQIALDTPSGHAVTGTRNPPLFEKGDFCEKLTEMDALDDMANMVIDALPDPFELRQLEDAVAAAEGKHAPTRLSEPACRVLQWLATSNYELTFSSGSELSERVITPGSAIESHGLEDARFVRFVDDDGSVTFYATYTAYDGFRVLPQLIKTSDFTSFRILTLRGACAANKGAALFPRRIDGRYVALSRFDAENNYVMRSDTFRTWNEAVKIESPESTWELARLGNCGSPIETDAGWLVITHGVGPFREYSLGAILLDINDPSHVIGHLDEPLLSSSENERDGYVPNVVYSCGAIVHRGKLILPYGIADTATRIARIPVGPLLAKLAR